MKYIYIVTALLLSSLFLPAQGSWKVLLNNKVLLSTGREDEKANTKKITATEWKKNGYLKVCYEDVKAEKEWCRSFFFNDENDNELIRKDSVTRIKIPIAALKKAFAGRKKIQVFTVSVPTDPDLAARARIRRVHLCTLELP